MTTRAWYLVHSKARQEDTRVANLERQRYQACLPRMCRRGWHADRWRERAEALFPHYLFRVPRRRQRELGPGPLDRRRERPAALQQLAHLHLER